MDIIFKTENNSNHIYIYDFFFPRQNTLGLCYGLQLLDPENRIANLITKYTWRKKNTDSTNIY